MRSRAIVAVLSWPLSSFESGALSGITNDGVLYACERNRNTSGTYKGKSVGDFFTSVAAEYSQE